MITGRLENIRDEIDVHYQVGVLTPPDFAMSGSD
jgi:hypothetical protein